MGRSVQMQTRAAGRVALAIAKINRITGVIDRTEIAKEAAAWILSRPTVTPQDAISAKAGSALLAVLEDDQTAAGELYAFLLDQRSTMATSVASVDRLLGLLSHTAGNLDQSSEHFDDALTLCRKANYKPELAWACCDYAELLLERDGEGDRDTATALIDESLAISNELGMRPLLERALSRREILKA